MLIFFNFFSIDKINVFDIPKLNEASFFYVFEGCQLCNNAPKRSELPGSLMIWADTRLPAILDGEDLQGLFSSSDIYINV